MIGAELTNFYNQRNIIEESILKQLKIEDYNNFKSVWKTLKSLLDEQEGPQNVIHYLEEILEKKKLEPEAEAYYTRKVAALYIMELEYLDAAEHIVWLIMNSEDPTQCYYTQKALVDLGIITQNLGANELAIKILNHVKLETDDAAKKADLEIYKSLNLAQNKIVLQDYEGALQDLEHIEHYIRDIPDWKQHEIEEIKFIRLAQSASDQGNAEQARYYLEQVDEVCILEDGGAYQGIGVDYSRVLGKTYWLEGRLEDAQAIYQAIIYGDVEGRDYEDYRTTLIQLMHMSAIENNFEDVMIYNQQIQEIGGGWNNTLVSMSYKHIYESEMFYNIKTQNNRLSLFNKIYFVGLCALGVFSIKLGIIPLWQRGRMRKQIQAYMTEYKYFLTYQPIINPKNNQIVGVEALLRLKDKGKIIYPSVFIPQIQKSGMMKKLVLWQLQELKRDYNTIKTMNNLATNFYISLNISLEEISDVQFVEQLKVQAADLFNTGMQICLEITENVGITDESLVQRNITELMKVGFRIAVDDFGVEYSNIAILDNLNFHILKLDKHFADHLKDSKVVQSILQVINNLSKELDIHIVIEGVEEEWQRDLIETYDSQHFYIQGYYYSKPLEVEQLKDFNIN